MPYADSDYIKEKYNYLRKQIVDYLPNLNIDPKLFFMTGETVTVPDLHGDFTHFIQTLYLHGAVSENLESSDSFSYVFLGDIYDRAPDSDVIDFWLNKQIKTNKKVFRLIGNHEIAFCVRDKEGFPIIFPSQDSIKDISNNFLITEELLRNIASGNMLAAYAETSELALQSTLYVHSYVVDDDFLQLGLEKEANIELFAHTLNERFKLLGQKALEIFAYGKDSNNFDWEGIKGVFHEDPLFNFYGSKRDIETSFIWRRTGIPALKTYPAELDINIPNNIYQIVGHTPVFSFNLPSKQSVNKPFVLQAKVGGGMVQFSDVGIGYYYKPDDLKRPNVVINRKFAIPLSS